MVLTHADNVATSGTHLTKKSSLQRHRTTKRLDSKMKDGCVRSVVHIVVNNMVYSIVHSVVIDTSYIISGHLNREAL